jgi:hypothetical protein
MLPPRTVTRLNDRFGDYVINVQCRKCKHSREIDPHALAKLVGWEAELEKLADRFRCSKCHAKSVDLQIGFEKKPRRWNSHPS